MVQVFFRGRQTLPSNRENLMEGFEGFSIYPKDSKVFYFSKKDPKGVGCLLQERKSCQATTTKEGFEGCPVSLKYSNDPYFSENTDVHVFADYSSWEDIEN